MTAESSMSGYQSFANSNATASSRRRSSRFVAGPEDLMHTSRSAAGRHRIGAVDAGVGSAFSERAVSQSATRTAGMSVPSHWTKCPALHAAHDRRMVRGGIC
jgi:hypothetical protein